MAGMPEVSFIKYNLMRLTDSVVTKRLIKGYDGLFEPAYEKWSSEGIILEG